MFEFPAAEFDSGHWHCARDVVVDDDDVSTEYRRWKILVELRRMIDVISSEIDYASWHKVATVLDQQSVHMHGTLRTDLLMVKQR